MTIAKRLGICVHAMNANDNQKENTERPYTMIEIKVTVNETGEAKTFDTIEAARDWAESVRQTLGMWDGKPTFSAVQVTTEEVVL